MNLQRFICALRSSPLWCTRNRSISALEQWPEFITGLDISWYARKFRNEFSFSAGTAEYVNDYLENSARLFRNPNLAFDEFWYRHEYQDANECITAGKYRSGWEHYLHEGARKQYNPTAWFDERWYQKQNSDIVEGIKNGSLLCGFEHFLLYGIRRDLAPSIYFNPAWYRKQYMSEEGKDGRSWPIVHYLLASENLRKCPAPFFDEVWYRATYVSDYLRVKDIFPVRTVYDYYLVFGRQLGHSPSPYFNEMAYREINPSASSCISAGLYASGFEHYVNEGCTDGIVAPTHVGTAGVDYAGPAFMEMYEQSLYLNLKQLLSLQELIETL